MKLVSAAILLGLVLAGFKGYAQADTSFLSHVVNSLDKYSEANPVEKVYLHLDRTGYVPGDTVWFKAYTVAGEKHGLSAISSILHVELLTEKDSVIGRIAIPLGTGVGWGDFALPFLIKNGNYHVRAYTDWMRNYHPAYFFDQAIRIGELQASITAEKQKNDNPDVQFFAEGGSLINGLRSKMAIKSISVNGVGEDVDGLVVDSDGNEVAAFSTQHLGMGVFALLPQTGKTYKAKIIHKNGLQFTVNLPKAQEEGFAIAVNNSLADSMSIRVASSAKLFDTKKNTKYYLVAQSGGKVYFTAGFTLSAQSFSTQIDKKRFPTGIVQFTLFAENGEPLNERIAFIQHNDGLKLNISAGKSNFLAREKVNITLNASDRNLKPVIGSFSASVINENLSNENTNSVNGILSSLLLTSDIKGNIEQPNYYFINTGDKINADLDLLMLTQGYHRFEWKQVLTVNDPVPGFEPEKALQLSGYVENLAGKPVPNSKVSLITTDSGFFKMDTITNQAGKFTFRPIPDEIVKYVIQARTGGGKKDVKVVLDTIAAFTPRATGYISAEKDSAKELTTYQKQIGQQIKLRIDKRTIQLREVVIKDKKEAVDDPFAHAANPDQLIKNFPKEGTGETLSQFLQQHAIGVTFLNNRPYNTRVIARTRGGASPPPMQILLDGAYIDYDVYMSLNLTDIESAEILRTTGKGLIYGPERSGAGMLFLISRKHTGSRGPSTPDVINFQSKGLYKSRVFYSPKYDAVKINTQIPDLRTSIYWKPDIITDKDGNAAISFFNADTKGTYQVLIEGIDADGNLGHKVYTYKVE
ncbi:TonB-dependent receptor [Mucilaginibacter sp. FT3.2]|uniref:TonB-dependent receptor n=1 Tax=Mucilaginibacter sp. FT3.2 TaxID=2723090 RepID=UPI0016221EA7|nr:TonB-dependent receptor [Mucilaginibacter sp. FT3.2]MBB6234484.1 hypothetical protein [Mucilaginibacter sp. FT3.2]